MSAPDGCIVTVAPKALSLERVSVPVPGGVSLAQMLACVPGGGTRLRVMIDGEVIPEARWQWVYPSASNVIAARRQVAGGGGGGRNKNLGQIVAGVVIIAAAVAISFASYGTLTPFAQQVALLGAGVALSGVVGLISARPRKTVDSAVGGAERFTIQSTQNAFEPYGPIPYTFGTIRTFPKAAAVPFTEIVNGDQYLRQVFVVSYGERTIDPASVKIGETLFSNFSEAEIEIRPGTDADAPLTLYARDVSEAGLSILVDQASGWVQQTTIAGVSTISVDLTAQAGLGRFQDDGDFKGVHVALQIEYAVAGSGAWVPAPNPDVWTRSLSPGNPVNPAVMFSNNHSITNGETVTIAGATGDWAAVNGTWTASVSDPDLLGVPVDASSFAYSAWSGTVSAERSMMFGGKSVAAVRQNKTWDVPVGQYDVRIKRLTPDSGEPSTSDAITWTALRTLTDVPPVTKGNLAVIAIRLKATNELNGIVNQLSCLASAKCQVYNGSTWSLQATNNPAWAYVDVLTGPANDGRVPLSRIDADAMKVWADNCTAAGREFNYTLAQELPVRDLLAMIATAGRATPSINLWDGKYSVVEDKHQAICRQHFSPRNSWGYELQRYYVELPHGIKAEFLDETADYQQETQIVYRAGYSESTATKFETLAWEGVTHPDRVFEETDFHLRSLEARPEVHTFNVDVESLACQRGDWVRLAAPAALIGSSYGRIIAVGTSGTDVTTITLDAICVMEAGKSYEVQMRQADTTPIDRAIDTVAGEQTVLTFTTPIPNTEDQPAVGDLVLFGETNLVSVDLIVKTITRFDGIHARVEAINRADEIHTPGMAPVWLSHISLPANPLAPTLPVPIIEHIDSSEVFLVRGPEGSLQARMSVQLRLPSGPHGIVAYFQVQHRLQDVEQGPGAWMASPAVPAEQGEVLVTNVLEGQVYDVRARSTNGVGLASDWSPVLFHTVVGKSSPPPNVTTFTVNRDADGTRRFEWTLATKPLDFAGVRIKWKVGTGHTWADLADLHTDLLVSSPFETNLLALGTYTFGIKMVDTSGNESTTALLIEGFLDDPRLGGALVQESARAQGWPGTKTDCVVDVSGDLIAQDPTTTWDDLAAVSWDSWGTWERTPANPIVYEHPAIDVGAVLTFNPLVSFTGTGTPTITESHSDDDVSYSAFAAITGQITARYIKIKVSMAHAAARATDVNIIIDAEIQTEHLNDIDMATLSGTTGDRRLPLQKTYSLITKVSVTLQGVTAGYTWSLEDRNPTLGPRIKVWDGSGTLTDVSAIDADIGGVA